MRSIGPPPKFWDWIVGQRYGCGLKVVYFFVTSYVAFLPAASFSVPRPLARLMRGIHALTDIAGAGVWRAVLAGELQMTRSMAPRSSVHLLVTFSFALRCQRL
ncbi:hypothetical protein B0H14DRAFT_2589089 [Mycena olivaceomarginata]|nr:hypothetical protein B0H14DRAFT_2589089 [Mycena olivaceomarginata]